VGIQAFQCPDCPSPRAETEVVDAAKSHVGAATDDINQVIAGLEAQRRRQETKATEAQELLQVQRLYQEVSEKAAALQEREQALRQQQVAVQSAIAQAKGKLLRSFASCNKAPRQRQLPSKQRMP